MKLIVCGCSRTYGWALSNEPNDYLNGNKLAWPNHFKTHMGFTDLVNLSKPGIDNNYIAKSIMEYSVTDTNKNHYLIQWTSVDRASFYDEKEKEWITVGPFSLDKSDKNQSSKQFEMAEVYYKHIYSKYHSIIHSQQLIYLTQLHLESLGISYRMFTFFNDKKIPLYPGIIPGLNLKKEKIIPLDYYSVESEFRDLALDGNHEGVKFQIRFAEILADYYKKNNILK